jgi:hypothetical protein
MSEFNLGCLNHFWDSKAGVLPLVFRVIALPIVLRVTILPRGTFHLISRQGIPTVFSFPIQDAESSNLGAFSEGPYDR